MEKLTGKYKVIAEIIDYISENKVNSFYELMDYASENRNDWFKVLCDKTEMFVAFFDSEQFKYASSRP